MSKLFRFQPLTALAVTGMTVAMLATGCGEDNPISGAQGALCCKEFKVGADLSGATFGLKAEAAGQFRALAQASSDLAVVGNGALLDVLVACENIARDLGADAAKVDEAVAKGDKDGVKETCALATAQIKARFGAKGSLKIDFQEPVCSASVQAQASCEGSCDVNANCDAAAQAPKCTGGKLSVECSGSCDVTAEAPEVSCTGSCTGKCGGSCTAEANATVDCEGTCEGNCTVNGNAASGSGVQADGTCKGKCDGTCTAKAGAKVTCEGTCSGTCDAKCEARPGGVKMECDGKCEGTAEAPKCEGGKLELQCNVDADCKASCSASASARAECQPPSLNITYAGAAGGSAAAQAQIQAGIASLKANLPNLLVVLRARGEAFVGGIDATVRAAGKLSPGDLSGEAALCIVPIAAALTEASANFKASFEASVDVAGAVGIEPQG